MKEVNGEIRTDEICPMMGKRCLFNDCAWYDSDRPRCAIFIIGDYVRRLSIQSEVQERR